VAERVTVIARMRAKPGQEALLRKLLLSLIEPTRAETGCINYDLHESTSNPGEFLFHENWTTVAALEAHLNSPHIAEAFRQVPDLLIAPPELTQWNRIA
jgi:quinol monooxygenase YgiN